jgi:hypothetical protein
MTKTDIIKKYKNLEQYDNKYSKTIDLKIFQSEIHANHLLFRILKEGKKNHSLSIEHYYVEYNVENIKIKRNYKERAAIYPNQQFHDGFKEEDFQKLEENIKVPTNYEQITEVYFNKFLDTFQKKKEIAKVQKRENKKNQIKILKETATESQKIKYIYRTIRQNGYLKKNKQTLKNKLNEIKALINLDLELDIIEISFNVYTLNIIDFTKTKYMMLSAINNENHSLSETILLELNDKTDLFNLLLNLGKTNLSRVQTNNNNNEYSHYMNLYINDINKKIQSTEIANFFNYNVIFETSKTRNREILDLIYFNFSSKTDDLNFHLIFKIIPAREEIILLSSNRNHNEVLAVVNQITKRADRPLDIQLKIIDSIDNIDSFISDLKLNKDTLSLPNFKTFKHLLTWLKLKKIDLIY